MFSRRIHGSNIGHHFVHTAVCVLLSTIFLPFFASILLQFPFLKLLSTALYHSLDSVLSFRGTEPHWPWLHVTSECWPIETRPFPFKHAHNNAYVFRTFSIMPNLAELPIECLFCDQYKHNTVT